MRVANSSLPMRNHQNGTSGKRLADEPLDAFIGVSIKRAGCLIHKYQFRRPLSIVQDGSTKTEELHFRGGEAQVRKYGVETAAMGYERPDSQINKKLLNILIIYSWSSVNIVLKVERHQVASDSI